MSYKNKQQVQKHQAEQQSRMRYRLEEVENGWILTISMVNGAVETGVLSRKVYKSMGDALTGIEEHWDFMIADDDYDSEFGD